MTHVILSAGLAAALSLALLPAARAADAAETKATAARPAVLRVGPERKLKAPGAAARVARDGDVVEIDAGLYEGDVAVWTQRGLTIRGVGGRAHLRANGASAEGKATWVVKGADTRIENVEFSGATAPHRNGAGIRLEGAGLRLRNCYFHGNENGILTGANPASDIVIEHSEFARNGYGNGYSHNLYIGTVRSFTLRYSYVHRAVVGHNVKSRALRNHIAYNRIADEADGRSSYAIDLPDGGLSYVIGNVLHQGPATENNAIVAYGAEGLKNPVNELHFVHNTVVNDLPTGGRFIFVKGEGSAVRVVNNVFSGPGEVLSGAGELHNNVLVGRADFLDPDDFDYRLAKGSAAIGRAVDPGRAGEFDLRPTAEYVHPMQRRSRVARETRTLGAFEYRRAPKPRPQALTSDKHR